MKKFVSIIFILILSITPIIFAEGRSMTEKEQNEFVNYINQKVIIPFTTNIKNAKYIKVKIEKHSIPPEEIMTLNNFFEKTHKEFDCDYCIYTLPFQKTLELYHNHVSNINNLVEQPLCCSGLTSFVVKELMNRGIECRYVLLEYETGGYHDVAIYKTYNKWYVCDLHNSLTLNLLQKYCNDKQSIQRAKLKMLGDKNMPYTDLLKMQKNDYKHLFCNKPPIWKEIELTEEILKKDTVIARSHWSEEKTKKLIIGETNTTINKCVIL